MLEIKNQTVSGEVEISGKKAWMNSNSAEINVNLPLNISAKINRATGEHTVVNSEELKNFPELQSIVDSVFAVLTTLNEQL